MNVPWPFRWLHKLHDSSPCETAPDAKAQNVNAIIAKLETRTQRLADAGEKVFEKFRSKLEAEYPGQYVMINVDTHDYVVAKTITEVHKSYRRSFPGTPGWCTRIGASVFAHAS